MSDHLRSSVAYCPVCGTELDHAEAVAAGSDLRTQGVFERDGAHLMIEGAEIRVFSHAEGGD